MYLDMSEKTIDRDTPKSKQPFLFTESKHFEVCPYIYTSVGATPYIRGLPTTASVTEITTNMHS